ncbi:MAG: Gfo/Idh/MocA family oxidoreductase [Clostridia bacterium]|nr:Gfo/Idh/MocA family oxidoreductase [Clostridia bacterium]
MKKLRVALVGCGRISTMHLKSTKMLNGLCELVAVCDNKTLRAQDAALEYGVSAYTDHITMLDEAKPDVLHICLPHYLHTRVASDAFKRGIHVLCEKPMDIDYESAVKAVEEADKQGVLYGVVSQCRYNNAARFVKAAIESGRLGKVVSAASFLTWSRSDEYYSMSDWKGTWDKEGGGVVIDQAIHSIDLVNWMINDEIESISCHMANRGHDIVKVEDTAEGFITYKGGARYGFYCMNNYGCDLPIEIKLLCERGRVSMGYDDAYIDYFDGTHEEAHMEAAAAEINYGGGKDYWGIRHVNQIEQFYRACLGEEPLEISGREALKTHRLIISLYEAGGFRKG